MCLRRSSSVHLCKVFSWTRTYLLTETCVLQNVNVRLNGSYAKNNVKKLIHLNISNQSDLSRLSKHKYHTSKSVFNKDDGEKTNKSSSNDKSDSNKFQEPNMNTENKPNSTDKRDNKSIKDVKVNNQNKTNPTDKNDKTPVKDIDINTEIKTDEINKKSVQDLNVKNESKTTTDKNEESLVRDPIINTQNNIASTDKSDKKPAQDAKINTQSKTSSDASDNKSVQDQNKQNKSTSSDKKDKKPIETQNRSKLSAARAKFLSNRIIKKNRFTTVLKKRKAKIITLLCAIAGVFYLTHLSVEPIKKRKKFNMYSEQQTKTLGKTQSDYFKIKYTDRMEVTGKNYERVLKIVINLMQWNSDLVGMDGGNWNIFILDGESLECHVLANRDIFVFTGLLETVQNDDLLASVLAHEMAHVMLNHTAEVPTYARLLLSLILHPVVTVSVVLPEVVVSPFLRTLSVAALMWSMGSKLEQEADSLSVDMMANACYDPRKAKEVWMTMEALGRTRRVKLLRTHPVSKDRYSQFDSLMPKAFNHLNKHCTGTRHPYFR